MSEWLDDDEKVGEVQLREVVKRVEVERLKDGDPSNYHVRADRRSLRADILNMATAASGMKPGSMIELGGDRWKRVTITKTPTGEKYVYVEVGDRE